MQRRSSSSCTSPFGRLLRLNVPPHTVQLDDDSDRFCSRALRRKDVDEDKEGKDAIQTARASRRLVAYSSLQHLASSVLTRNYTKAEELLTDFLHPFFPNSRFST